MGTSLPRGLGERARDILSGRIAPVAARDAATVVLLRDNPLEVYLLERKSTMAFAAGAHVFPGGSVDPRDTDHAVAWAGPSPAEWGQIFRADERTARGLVCAAVRETFEESGVLLAGPSASTVVADTTAADWEADRLALIARTLSFAEFLDRRGLVLRSDLLKAWGHWITPEVEPRRFDTRFFLAALPPGQRTRDVGGEADRAAWMRPEMALAGARSGDLYLMPPTFHTLTEIAAFDTIDDLFAHHREITTVLPVATELDGEVVFVVPGYDSPLPGRVRGDGAAGAEEGAR